MSLSMYTMYIERQKEEPEIMSTTHGEGGDHVINGGGGGGVGGGDSNMRKKAEGKEEKEKQQLLPYLNEDIVTKIIIKTPAEARINRLRYVCKLWHNLINNDPCMALYRLLSSKSVPCLLFQTHDQTCHRYLNSGTTRDEEAYEILKDLTFTTYFIKMGMEGIHQKEYDLSTSFRNLCITACANGLVFAIAKPDRFSYSVIYYVVNPLINQRLRLPLPLIVSYYLPGPGFIFLPSTGEYKVVVVTMGDMSQQYLQILTLSGGSGSGSRGNGSPCGSPYNINVDDLKWRLVEATPDKLYYSPLVVNEVFYWVHDTTKEDYIVSFDARAEKFYTTPHNFRRLIPQTNQVRKGGFIEMGGYLCFWHMAGRRSQVYSKLDVWILIKDSFRREWTKQYSINMNMDFMRTLKDHGHVVLSVGNGEVIIFQNNFEQTLWAYNLKSNEWWKLGNNLKDNDWIKFCGFHVNNTLDLKSLFSTEVEVLDLRSLFETE